MIVFRRIALFCLLLVGSVAAAQSGPNDAARFEVIEARVNEAEASLRDAADATAVSDARVPLQETRVQLSEFRRSLTAAKAQLEADISVLGPVPEGGQEPESLARLRSSYVERLAEVDRLTVLSNALAQRIVGLQEMSAEQLRSAFVDSVFERSPPPYLPASLAAAGAQATEKTAAVAAYLNSFTDGTRDARAFVPPLLAVLASLAVFYGLVSPLRHRIADQLWRRLPRATITRAGRSAISLTRTLTRVLLGGLGIFIVHRVGLESGLIPENGRLIANDIARAAFVFVAANALSRAIFSPRHPEWRVPAISDRLAAGAHWSAVAVALLFVVDQVIVAIWRSPAGLNEFVRLETLIAAIVFGGVLTMVHSRILRTQPPAAAGDSALPAKHPWRQFAARAFLLAPALAMIGASALGYAAFSRWLFEKAAYAAVFLGAVYVVRAFILNWSLAAAERAILGHKRATEAGEDMVGFWTRVSVDVLVAIAAGPFALALLGLSWPEIQTVGANIIGGVSIGAIRISPISIVWGLFLVVAILVTTRLLQRVLDTRVLPMTRLNPGARHSFTAIVGYVGLLIAFLTGVSAVGFDLSNLAIIAGALSVGIGFGLQSIVNNFVSGLILLFERPIKIGDWVITNSGEGTVKRINVRSTEIETFDRCSIIVPNSELVTSSVLNWTYKDQTARVTVAVGVSYDTDPEYARDVLLQCIEGHPEILSQPKSYVYFADFGDSSLNLELRVFIRDANDTLTVRNDLRFRVFSALKRAGVEIPFPQRDVHLKAADLKGRPVMGSET